MSHFQLLGYSSYWNSSRSDLLAMINSLDQLPTWFLTLSSRDLEWEDMIRALLKAKYKNSKDVNVDEINTTTMHFEDRNQLLREYPVIAARHFNHRFKQFIVFLKQTLVLGGVVVDYWWRVEFQARGSPHIHMMIWVLNAPNFNTVAGIILL